jgi:uncharacterized protein YneF (UPF0154 family)
MNPHGKNARVAWMVFGISIVWIILVVLLQIILIIGGILFFNVYLRKQIKKDTELKPIIDQAYIEAEKTRGDDEDLGGVSESKAT